ncbi:SAM-dependent methyltransferase [Janibacter limosus]|uniref:SAM-dependent methyltransferase n=1 Tax=Janibacter limosus TaxID=53458 RepID=UPI0035D9C301|nr:SAM-dependent methyltransferase [Janibacter limosus]
MVRTWEQAWHDALYGDVGFYRRPEGPAGHFATSARGPAADVLADALLELARRESLTTIVDVACGRGELLGSLAAQADPSVRLIGVDVVDRPVDLPERVEWLRSPGGTDLPDLGSPERALVLAHEWLDVVPCPVAQADRHGVLRTVLVDEDGTESLGEPLATEDLRWAQSHWPGPHACGDRVEVGRPRDAAFATLVARTGSGLVVAVDYGHTVAARPPAGTLTGFADGSACLPVPDGSCDVTAHVAMDTLGADGLHTQQDLLRGLGVDGTRPPVALARRDPAGYLAALAAASHASALTGPGAGDFLWALRRVG